MRHRYEAPSTDVIHYIPQGMLCLSLTGGTEPTTSESDLDDIIIDPVMPW